MHYKASTITVLMQEQFIQENHLLPFNMLESVEKLRLLILLLVDPISYPFCSHLYPLEERNKSVRFIIILSVPSVLNLHHLYKNARYAWQVWQIEFTVLFVFQVHLCSLSGRWLSCLIHLSGQAEWRCKVGCFPVYFEGSTVHLSSYQAWW